MDPHVMAACSHAEELKKPFYMPSKPTQLSEEPSKPFRMGNGGRIALAKLTNVSPLYCGLWYIVGLEC